MSKVRINDLARELEVKSKSILDALTAVGVTATKTHSSSIEFDEADKVREYLTKGRPAAAKPAVKAEPRFDLSGVSKPGDALKAILARKAAESGATAAPPRPVVAPAKPVVAPPVAAAPAPVVAPAKKTLMPHTGPRPSAVVVAPPAPPAIASRTPQTTVVVARPPAGAPPPVAAAPAAAKPAPPPPV
jgi:translation initiation factor IF-2